MAKCRLHNRLGSGGFVVQATLAAAGIAFDFDPLDSRPNEPLGHRVQDLNAWGQVPVLELETGAKLTEVAAILTYLAQIEQAVGHGPTLWIDDTAQYHRWSVFLTVNVYEGILRQSYTQRFFDTTTDEFQAARAELPANINDLIAAGVRQAATERTHQALLCIERETSEHQFLLSNWMSPCDIFLAMLYAWHSPQPDLPKCTWITTQVATHDVIRPIWEQNFHDRLDHKWHEL